MVTFIFLIWKFDNDIDVYWKDAHAGQYTHYSSFEPFSHKVTLINSLFYHPFKICSSSVLLNWQFSFADIFYVLEWLSGQSQKFMHWIT